MILLCGPYVLAMFLLALPTGMIAHLQDHDKDLKVHTRSKTG